MKIYGYVLLYIISLVRTSADADSSICPQLFCANATVTYIDPTTCDSSGLQAVQLAAFVHDGDTLVELLGPLDSADAAAVVISSPHGGNLKPHAYIPNRATTGPFCPDGKCETSQDSYTLEISLGLKDKIISNYCTVPYVVINHLHRSKLDANREITEAAQGNAVAEDAWMAFHNFIKDAQELVLNKFGTVVNSDGDFGVNGLLFDMHGYAGNDWTPTVGAPFIQWGYRLSGSTLKNYCPLDDKSPISGNAGTLSHAQDLPGQSLECLVRGPNSLGARVQPLNSGSMCGTGLPSFQYPDVDSMANDATYCTGQNAIPCHYYSGGYNLEMHEFLNWETKTGMSFNGVQAELPRCIRFGGSATRAAFADSLSVAVCSFMYDIYGDIGTC